MTCKNIENNMIPLKELNSQLKNIYESPNVVDNIPSISIEDIEFGVKWLTKGKTKDIEGYHAEMLKIGGSILIPHIHKLFNLAVNQSFPKPWPHSLIVPIVKNEDKNKPYNYRTIMVIPILAKLYIIILEKKISIWLESHKKRAKGKAHFRSYHSTVDHLVMRRINVEECQNNKTNLLCCFIDFRKYFDIVPRTG
jgi:hypothetical protein